MKIVPYLSQHKALLSALFVFAAIAGGLYASSQKTVYTAYTYFNAENTQIVLKDPQLFMDLNRSSFTVAPADRGSKIFKAECRSVLSPEIAAADLRALLESAHAWQKFVKVDPIRFSSTAPARLKHFLALFMGLCFASVFLIFVWEKRVELFYEDEKDCV